MKCPSCGYEARIYDFRYLYNAMIDAPISMRQCTECGAVIAVNELTGETGGI